MPVKKGTHLEHPGTYKLGYRSTGGRKRLPVEIRTARDESRERIVADIIRIRDYKVWQAEAKLRDIDTTVGERLFLTAYLTGNAQVIKNYEDRVYGKTVESHRFVGKEGEDRELLNLLAGVPPEDIVRIGRALAGVE